MESSAANSPTWTDVIFDGNSVADCSKEDAGPGDLGGFAAIGVERPEDPGTLLALGESETMVERGEEWDCRCKQRKPTGPSRVGRLAKTEIP